MNDIQKLQEIISSGQVISGPWRLTVWTKNGSPPSYIFSEEHASENSCPDKTDISSLLRQILDNTSKTGIFIEHFIHAESIKNAKTETQNACVARSEKILNGLRLCLEVVKISQKEHGERIHFCDPRCDIVSVLPDGKVYDSINFYTQQLIRDNNISEALLTIYEAFIHPLLSVVPDKKSMSGRLSGSMKTARSKMTQEQLRFFDEI